MIKKTYVFGSDYADINFDVPGKKSWTDEMWDSAAFSDLKSYVTNPDDYALMDVFSAIGMN